jgi:Uma2 family endonuclease
MTKGKAMNNLLTKVQTDTWVTATWDEYLQLIEEPELKKAKFYYQNGKLRIEMVPISSDHSLDHTIVIVAVNLYGMVKDIALNGRNTCSYRKSGIQECQPDASYYIGENADIVPWGTSIINLETYPPPDLVIEVANTSLADDMGGKRLLYEDLQVKEYWIVDVQNVRIIAFSIADGGSRRITQSQVLTGLEIGVLEEALRRTRQMNQSQVCAWLMAEFQK